ncbi:hypothetical protein [Methylophilus sp.]|uniref:hypothetical protein n=1 Tax=Methylophilus sp. TaxID=29541 RepID=UPI004036EAFE
MTVVPDPASAVALRFEIIKRLAPGFRHRMLGRMQPIALLSQLMDKKIQAGQTESGFLLKRLKELKDSLSAATNATVDLFSWLNPDDQNLQPLNSIVEECLDLLKMDIYTSNVVFHNTITSPALVKASRLRHVLAACLLTYIDSTEKAAQVTLSAQQVAGDWVLEMAMQPADAAPKQANALATFVNWGSIALISEGALFSKEQQRIVISNLV